MALRPVEVNAQSSAGWRAVGPLPATPTRCVDPTATTTLLLAYTTPNSANLAGTFAFNWATGNLGRVSERPFERCDPASGALFATAPGGGDPRTRPAYRFSRESPQLQPVERMPDWFAADGTRRAYAIEVDVNNGGATQLWVSEDGGSAWSERRLPARGSVSMAPADSRVLYLVSTRLDPAAKTATSTVYVSSDVGSNWEQRGIVSFPAVGNAPSAGLVGLESAATPVNTLLLTAVDFVGGHMTPARLYSSTDGGRTFAELWMFNRMPPTLVHTREGIVRLTRSPEFDGQPAAGLGLSLDGGRTWQALPLPAPVSDSTRLVQVGNAPDALLFTDNQTLWHSLDGGRSWAVLGPGKPELTITPAAPHQLLAFDADQLSVLDLPDAGRSLSARALPVGAAGGDFFPQTGHNLSRLFAPYWGANGGLAQFGYAKTEPFFEVNPADGRAYLVQYFERNRFEYHPENAGTRYEVLLGLLGNQLTESRRATGEAAFARVPPPADPTIRYAPETGHTLDTRFVAYWEANGGLAIYGYPISEPFNEVNIEDGRTYLVQYFERNRFEYHPENTGTRYEVLLGLLGNTLLRSRGWVE